MLQNLTPLQEFLLTVADDQLIIGHRSSEWIGLGPILEEDISFASIAQDKVGQSRVLYQYAHNLGLPQPDDLAFLRPENQYYCSHFVQLPTQDYALALVRHFLFDEAEAIRFELLRASSNADLAAFARKFSGEIKYHTLHARSIVKKLTLAGGEASERMHAAFAAWGPYAWSVFEPSLQEEAIIADGIYGGGQLAQTRWYEHIMRFLSPLDIVMPLADSSTMGGRYGHHTPYLNPLLAEMGEVFRLDPTAQW
jgi:ring-1,2-phenylacetyl-CoA epoxidase subunit PaaC